PLYRPLFPYTTLFRSRGPRLSCQRADAGAGLRLGRRCRAPEAASLREKRDCLVIKLARCGSEHTPCREVRAAPPVAKRSAGAPRSEEHTSELQSRSDL